MPYADVVDKLQIFTKEMDRFCRYIIMYNTRKDARMADCLTRGRTVGKDHGE